MGTLRAMVLQALIATSLVYAAGDARADGQPTIVRDSVHVTAFTVNSFHKDFDKWSWLPRLEFRVNGPIASGSQLEAEFSVGKAGCDPEVQLAPTQYVEDALPQRAKWARVACSFPNVRGWDKTGNAPGTFGRPYTLAGNPGEYEFKVLWHDHLARSIKFTVAADGTFDNGIATANQLGTKRIVVPVQIVGAQDGDWNRNAWRSAAFYANPLTGFTALP